MGRLPLFSFSFFYISFFPLIKRQSSKSYWPSFLAACSQLAVPLPKGTQGENAFWWSRFNDKQGAAVWADPVWNYWKNALFSAEKAALTYWLALWTSAMTLCKGLICVCLCVSGVKVWGQHLLLSFVEVMHVDFQHSFHSWSDHLHGAGHIQLLDVKSTVFCCSWSTYFCMIHNNFVSKYYEIIAGIRRDGNETEKC